HQVVGKSVLLTFALFKSEPPSGGTIGGRYRRNGYVLGLIQHPSGQAPQIHCEQAQNKKQREHGIPGAHPYNARLSVNQQAVTPWQI
ncbi:hypothetical protein, partial [Pseudomonas sp. IT-P176]|uniref:hypothetical protein n=1 Tax=Pseudomonas sp. IT-P176 TaxID=3026444 RepID=UPI0039E08572